jgi:hypothetical protein
MRANEFLNEGWSQKYKNSINCSHPKGFSQRAHCAGKKKHNESTEMEMVCEDCGMCQTHGNLNEIKKGQKDANGYTRCWPGKHAEGTKKGKNGGQVRNCVPNEGVAEGSKNNSTIAQKIFFARSNKTPKGWSYDHVGFITQDGKQIQMSGHKGNDVYVTNDVTDDPEFPKQNIKIVSLSKPVLVPTTNSVGAENCGTFVANVLQANGIKGIDTQKIYSVFKQPQKQGVAEGKEKRCMQCGMKNCKCPGDSCKCKPIAGWIPGKGFKKAMEEAAQKTMSRAAKGYEKYGKEGMKKLSQAGQQNASKEKMDAIRDKYDRYDESVDTELVEEFNLIESIINRLAEHNQVDAEVIWEDLESLTEDELYAFAVTSQLNEDWQKANKRDRTSGMSQKAVNAYRREHPGSKLQTAVTTKPSKLKRGSKASKRRKSYCSRSRGQMKMHNISCAKTPDKAICKARRRWNC